ncbi:MAG: hypothetical protein ACRC1K_13675 [Planctomycetia bacterium]
MDAPADARDLSYNLTHWKNEWWHVTETGLTAAAVLPVFGAIFVGVRKSEGLSEAVQAAVTKTATLARTPDDLVTRAAASADYPAELVVKLDVSPADAAKAPDVTDGILDVVGRRLDVPIGGTRPTGVINGTPTGTRKKINYNQQDTNNILADLAENHSADVLAKSGYKVEQQPPRRPGMTSKPDLKIEGNYFDVKTPLKSGVRSFVNNNITKKIHQSDGRFVIPLHNATFSLEDLTKQLKDFPVPGLKEVFVILKDDTMVQIVL